MWAVLPRPVLSIVPTMDEDMPKAGADALAAVLGQRDDFTQLQPEGTHEFKREYLEEVAAFFQRVL